MLSATSSIFSIIIIISIGYSLSIYGWFNKEIGLVFSKIVINISLPSLMIVNVMGRLDKQNIFEYKVELIIAFVCVLSSLLISWIIGTLIKLPKNKKAPFCAMFTFSNTIFIGLPVNLALFGEDSIIFVLMYYFANTFLFWTVGVYNLKKTVNTNNEKSFSFNTVKKIFSPPLLGFLLGIALVVARVNLPSFIKDTLSYLGALTTPLSMMFIGITISSIKINKSIFTLDSLVIIFGRFLIVPLIVFMAVSLMKFPLIIKNVFIMEAAMPIITQIAVVSRFYNIEYDYVSTLVSLTTALSLFTIPIYAIILK